MEDSWISLVPWIKFTLILVDTYFILLFLGGRHGLNVYMKKD